MNIPIMDWTIPQAVGYVASLLLAGLIGTTTTTTTTTTAAFSALYRILLPPYAMTRPSDRWPYYISTISDHH